MNFINLPEVSARPWSFTRGLEKFSHWKSLRWLDHKIESTNHTSENCSFNEHLGPFDWMIMLFFFQILKVLEHRERLWNFEVQYTSEWTIVNWLEISISAFRWHVLMQLLIAVSCSENLIFISWINKGLMNRITVDHIIVLLIIIIYLI